jgi:flagellar motor switch protein FliN/FliY
MDSPPADAALCWRQPFSEISGAISLRAGEPHWSAVGGHVLHSAGVEEQDQDAASLKSTYLEAIAQAASGLARTMSERRGADVTCASGAEASESLPGTAWAALQIELTEAPCLYVGVDAALVDALSAVQHISQSQGTAAPPFSAATPLANSKTFDLLLDVELPVTVSFGRALIPLKDVLKLTTGSIVELNRSIVEPVEVVVNNCVIARGEVVVVEGNFGVRIHQVISRQERMRSLN